MSKVVCPGSFDPLTNGHLDVITRASNLFDEVVVLVAVNEAKRTMFSPEERVALIEDAVADLDSISVAVHRGLLVDFCRDSRATAVVKGVRAPGDFDYELQMAQMNHAIAGVDTVLLPTAAEHGFIASSLVKEVAGNGGDVAALVPAGVNRALWAKVQELREV